MGICQCIEQNNNCYTNEIYSEKYYQENNLNTENNEEVYLVKGKSNRNFKASGFNNYNKTNPKKRKELLQQMNESHRSEILFEDFSYISKTAESAVDYYQHSKIMFDLINNIRINPEKYINSFDLLLNELKKEVLVNSKMEVEVEKTINEEDNNKHLGTINTSSNGNVLTTKNSNINEVIKNYFQDEQKLNNLIQLKEFLSKIVNSDRRADLIMWSEKVYLTAYDYLIEVEEKENFDEEFVKKSSSQRVSDKLKFSSLCVEFNLNGLFPPELTVLFLLLENQDRLRQILSDNYDYGAACLFPTKNSFKARTLFYFTKKNSKNVKITGINPLTQKPLDLSLNEAIFNDIQYKHLIVDGNYESDGNTLTATFILNNGEEKQETFLLS